jgi:hypothetical protein
VVDGEFERETKLYKIGKKILYKIYYYFFYLAIFSNLKSFDLNEIWRFKLPLLKQRKRRRRFN